MAARMAEAEPGEEGVAAPQLSWDGTRQSGEEEVVAASGCCTEGRCSSHLVPEDNQLGSLQVDNLLEGHMQGETTRVVDAWQMDLRHQTAPSSYALACCGLQDVGLYGRESSNPVPQKHATARSL